MWVRRLCLVSGLGAALIACDNKEPVSLADQGGAQEAGESLCADQADNDGDGLTDCADPSCASAPVCGGPGASDAGPNPKRDGGTDATPQPVSDGAGGWSDARVPWDGSTVEHYFPAQLKKEVDVLVVVDNSASMVQEQQNLVQNFGQFVDALATMSAGVPDLRVGVISTDLGAGAYNMSSCQLAGGDGGKLQTTARVAGCTVPSDPYIAYTDGVSNVPGPGDELQKVQDAFGCLALLGTGGCGFEQQLEAARLALDPSIGVNPGFLRDDALLAVLFVTDEDDCSAKDPKLFDPAQRSLTDPLGPLNSFRCFEFGVLCDEGGREVGPRHNCRGDGPSNYLYEVSEYVAFFQSLKPPGQVVVSAIAGPEMNPAEVGWEVDVPALKPSCHSENGFAVPAFRIKALTDALGPNGLFNDPGTNICAQTFGPGLRAFGDRVASQLGYSCLGELVDTDGAPGLQAQCLVEETSAAGQVQQIPACTSDSASCDPCPCWRVEESMDCAGLGTGYSLRIVRSQGMAPGSVVRARCLAPNE